MPTPAVLTEPEAIAAFIQTQLKAIRAAAYGLTEYLRHIQDPGQVASEAFTPERYAEYFSSSALTDDETLEGVVADFDAAAARYLAAVRAADPDRATIQPPAPWDGRDEPFETVERVHLLHAVEEMARHAGHADILREQLDRATSAELQTHLLPMAATAAADAIATTLTAQARA